MNDDFLNDFLMKFKTLLKQAFLLEIKINLLILDTKRLKAGAASVIVPINFVGMEAILPYSLISSPTLRAALKLSSELGP